MELTLVHLAGAFGVLGSAVAALWGWQVAESKRTRDQHEREITELKTQRESDQTELRHLTGQVGEMKGYKLGIEDLSAQVLDKVESLKAED